MRPIDLARDHGLSTQAVRNYEDAGVLPPAERTPSGYRVYGETHARALRAFLALVPAHGHRTATAIMRAVNAGAVDDALTLVDESHAQLLQDRRTLAAVEDALRDVSPPPTPRSGRFFVGALAGKLGVRPATLRKWERAGVVRPQRDPATGYRVYTAADVRDAHLAHQLRRGGYPLARIAPLLDQVRKAGGVVPLDAALADWRDRLTRRGTAMLAAAAELHTHLSPTPASTTRRAHTGR
ncbi:DNA-binding transcriptional MerR regulator [Saccharothrix coeruleofusca]|uniref:TioE family transcriptional regulator n=1 Tax=Saccharothrix coeruleofusca TaxID=33919 RepID=UPI001AEB5822|nr:TioE family transcriptional regulator [Saccharothrix coeruleofusca]MBP2338925.1 DNA-binding transcriptional MerR regulator [Saccharothrix coeruleofusca]